MHSSLCPHAQTGRTVWIRFNGFSDLSLNDTVLLVWWSGVSALRLWLPVIKPDEQLMRHTKIAHIAKEGSE